MSEAIVIFRINTATDTAELHPVGGQLSDGTVKGLNDIIINNIKRCTDIRHVARRFSNLSYQVGSFTDDEATKIFDTAKLKG